MTDINARNQSFFWATRFLRSLFRSGVRHLIISPGSRSTPLTFAAAALPGFQKQVILDERSAAFTALGIGKATHHPAALICTSGTAVANYFPAVIEARKSSVPLLMLSADRPPELHGTGANQTIEQHHIFGDYPVFFRDAGMPVMNEKDMQNLEQLASEAVAGSIKEKGPVHLNFPFSKPLEPELEVVANISRENKKITESSHASPTSILNDQTAPFRLDDTLQQQIHTAEKPLVIIGQLAPGTETAPIFRLAEALHAPILSESEQDISGPNALQESSHSNGIQGFEGFLRDPGRAKKLEPDLILRFGRQPASKSLLQAIKGWRPRRHIHFSDTEYRSDIAGTTTDHVSWNGNPFDMKGLFNSTEETSTTFVAPPHFAPPRVVQKKDNQMVDPVPIFWYRDSAEFSRWLQRWKKQEEEYFKRSDRLLETQQTLTDGHIYHHLAPRIPNDWFTFFSNSFPARDRSIFGRWSGPNASTAQMGSADLADNQAKYKNSKERSARKVFTNRGASGIDGITSTAMGLSIGANQSGILFTGDLAFLHDTNALLNKKALQNPLVVIVINNRGGAIFRMLPIVEHKAHFGTYFETPQQADITALANSYGIHTQTITTIGELQKLDLQKLVSQSDSMLHVVECQTDTDASMQLRHKLWGKD